MCVKKMKKKVGVGFLKKEESCGCSFARPSFVIMYVALFSMQAFLLFLLSCTLFSLSLCLILIKELQGID